MTTTMFPNFTPFTVETEPGVHIHGLKGPAEEGNANKPALLLLHGFPQTLHIWHKTAPALSAQYAVILIDIRGYGRSTAPEGASYSKTAMAADCVAVMRAHGHARFFVCGHDRGARIAHKLLVDAGPSVVPKAILLDICPTLAMYEATSREFAAAYHHWFWLIQPAPLPETMIGGNPRKMLELMMGRVAFGGETGFFAKEAMERYVESAGDEKTVHAWCEDYRAAATVDCEEQRQDLEAGRKIRSPVRVLWGKKGICEKLFDTLAEWRKVSDAEVGGEAVESGHYVPEEVPDVLMEHIREFLV